MSNHVFSCVIALSLATLQACSTAPEPRHIGVDEWQELHAQRVGAAPAALDESAQLHDLLVYAGRNNLGLSAAFEEWQAALEHVSRAVRRPEPRVTLGAYLQSVETRTGPMRGRVALNLPLPRYGALDAAGAIASAKAEAARERFESALFDLEHDVRKVWYELAWLERAIEVARGHRELLMHWESISLARLETGIGRHADVIRTQVELGKLIDRIATLEDLRFPLSARLNAALGRAAAAPLPTPRDCGHALEMPNEEMLLADLGQTSPALRALAHRAEAARQEIALAQTEASPRFYVGAEYVLIDDARQAGVPDSGRDAIALSLGADLPIWRESYDAGVREGRAALRAILAESADRTLRLGSEVHLALYSVRDANRRLELYSKELIPKGEEAVSALDSAYQTGEASFLELIDAQRVLLEFQLEAARAEADRFQAFAKLEHLTGARLHTTETITRDDS